MKLKEPVRLNPNSDTAYFIGALQGDGDINKSFNKKGSIGTYAIRIAVGHRDKSFVVVLKKLIKENFNYNPIIYNSNSCYKISIYDRSIVRAFEEFKRDMKIPDFVLNDNKLLAAYLQGLFDTDGCCYSRKTNGVIDFSNNKKDLIEAVKCVLQVNFNIKSYIYTNQKGNYKPVYRLMISNKSNLVPFIEKIGFRHPRKNKISKELLKVYKEMPERAIRNTGHARIIYELQSKREMSINDIAKKLNLHRETVKEHMERLHDKKVVEKRVVYFNRWGVIKKASLKKYYWRLKNGA